MFNVILVQLYHLVYYYHAKSNIAGGAGGT